MAVFVRAKHVTDPLDERVRAGLRGELNCAEGSRSGHESGDPSFFPRLLHAFLDASDDDLCRGGDSETESSAGGEEASGCADSARAMLRELLDPLPSADLLRFRVVLELVSAMEAAAAGRLTGTAFRRAVMAKLRERGYNAGICKAQWKSGGGLTAGSYEYIDVLFAAEEEAEVEGRRYIVDVGFSAEFEVARATEEYGSMAAALPPMVVARPEKVEAAVRIMAEAARRSLRSRGMSVPPWRKKRYMMAKWIGAYRRTVNALPSAREGGGGWDARCRTVGFGRPVE